MLFVGFAYDIASLFGGLFYAPFEETLRKGDALPI